MDAEEQLTPEERATRPRRQFELLRPRAGIKKELAALGITRSARANAPILILVSLLVVAGVAVGVAVLMKLGGEVAVGLVAVFVTLAGLLVAVLQWRLGLEEKALDALYQRIGLSNEMRLTAFKSVSADHQRDEEKVLCAQPALYRFYVYTEIDNVEYAVRRYRFGLGLTEEIVHRQIRHFRVRCGRSETFRRVAYQCVEAGGEYEGGYFEETKAVIRQLVSERGAGPHPAS